MLRVSTVASRLSLSTSKVYELIEQGSLGHYRIEGAIRVSEEQLQEYLNSTKREPRERQSKQSSPRQSVRLRHVHL
jgi:excisionase family DNA binding protein